MVVSTRPIDVRGRILDPPTLRYRKGIVVCCCTCTFDSVLTLLKRPRDGAWNVVGQEFHTPKAMTCWALVNFCPERIPAQRCSQIIHALMKCCGALGKNCIPQQVLLIDVILGMGSWICSL